MKRISDGSRPGDEHWPDLSPGPRDESVSRCRIHACPAMRVTAHCSILDSDSTRQTQRERERERERVSREWVRVRVWNYVKSRKHFFTASSKKQSIEVHSWPTIGSFEIGILQILNYEFLQSFYRNWFSMWWEMNVFWLWRWHCENLGSISQVQICSFFTIFFVIVFKVKFSSSHVELSMTIIRLLLREHICACCIMGRLWLFLVCFGCSSG